MLFSGAGFPRLNVFKVRGPGKLNQDRHQDGGRDRVGSVVSEPDGEKTEDERFDFRPVPKVLVENIESKHQRGQQQRFHTKEI
jgi:hypothetical protein